MSYTVFFLSLSAIAALVFIGIFEAGWMETKDTKISENKTEIPTGTIYKGEGRSIYVDKNNPSYTSNVGTLKPQIDNDSITWKNPGDSTQPVPTHATSLQSSTIHLSLSKPFTTQSSLFKVPTTSSLTSQSPEARAIPQASDSCIQENRTNEDGGVIKWEKTTKTCEAWFIDISDHCRGVDIIIDQKMTLKGDLGEYLIISRDTSLIHDVGNPILTWKLNSDKKFRIPDRATAYIQLITNKTTTGGSLTITYQCYSKISETTVEPTTEPPATLPAGANEVIMIHLGGLSPQQFYFKLVYFRPVIANMTYRYCQVKQISLLSDPTPQDVFFSWIGPCMTTWPDSDKCVELKMGVSVNNTGNNYELTMVNLQDMWNSMARNDAGLKDLGLEVYDTPDNETTLLLWMAVFLGVLVVFTLLLLFLWRVQPFRVYSRMKRDEPRESEEIITEIFPDDPAIFYEPDSNIDYFPPKSPGADSSTDDFTEGRSSIAQLDTMPRYGPPPGFGAAIHFYGQRHSQRGFENLDFVADKEESKNQTNAPMDNYLQEKPRASFGAPMGSYLQEKPKVSVDTSMGSYLQEKPRASVNTSMGSYLQAKPRASTDFSMGSYLQEKPRASVGTSMGSYLQEKPRAFDNPSYVQDDEEEKKADTPTNNYLQQTSRTLDDLPMGSYLQEKPRPFNNPPLIEEEEEEEEQQQQDEASTNHYLKEAPRTFNNQSLIEEKENMEAQNITEWDPIQNEEKPNNNIRLDNETDHIYDIPKYPVRRLSAEVEI